jgi:1,4-dihydroxy-2-naphthoate octaprenyltransferase
VTGKRTLAVRLGDPATRRLYLAMLAVAAVVVVVLAASRPWCWVTLASFAAAVRPARRVATGAVGRDLIAVLAGTNIMLLAYGVLLAAGLMLSAR